MRLSERIQNGNTTNFLKSLNEGVKLDEARSHKEDNEKGAPRKSTFDKVSDGEVSIGVYDDKDERNYADRYKEPIYAKRNKIRNFKNIDFLQKPIKDIVNKSATHLDYEKPLNKDSADYKKLKADSELPFPDEEAGEKAKEILKRRGIKTESANLKEEISEEVIGVAKQIADKIQETGIMNFEDVDNMAAELLGITIDELKNKELDTDVHIALNYQGINNNFGNGDFFTQEYAKEHPEVLDESCNKKANESALNESKDSTDVVLEILSDMNNQELSVVFSSLADDIKNFWADDEKQQSIYNEVAKSLRHAVIKLNDIKNISNKETEILKDTEENTEEV